MELSGTAYQLLSFMGLFIIPCDLIFAPQLIFNCGSQAYVPDICIMSDSEDNANPIDELIVKPAKRLAAQRRATADAEVPEQEAPVRNKKKRKKSSSNNLQGLHDQAQQRMDGGEPMVAAAAAHQPAAAAAPKGVVIVEDEQANAQKYELQKLLRAPRYFDEVYEPKGVACWRCGKRGHLAKDCTLAAAKPCCYCAQYGHEPRDCPHRLCFRCGKPGHITKDCPHKLSASGSNRCMRCGRSACPAADYTDWYRFEGGCTSDYYNADLDMARCFVCGGRGHLSCQPTPLSAPLPSCWNCGGQHWAENCPKEYPAHLMAERLQDRDRQKQQRQQQQRQEVAAAVAGAGHRQQQQQQQWYGQPSPPPHGQRMFEQQPQYRQNSPQRYRQEPPPGHYGQQFQRQQHYGQQYRGYGNPDMGPGGGWAGQQQYQGGSRPGSGGNWAQRQQQQQWQDRQQQQHWGRPPYYKEGPAGGGNRRSWG